VRTGGSLFRLCCDLHKKRHFFRLEFGTSKLESLFAEKLLVYEVVQRPLLFEELLVVGKIDGWKNPLKKVPTTVLLESFSETLLFFLCAASNFWARQT